VAFDDTRRRLGRGGGYYDATLGAASGRALRVGLAFECQMVEAVPAAAHDIQVDAVATELRLVGGRGG
jgi:5-formyltetrahydrofolate cyclo-ligase